MSRRMGCGRTNFDERACTKQTIRAGMNGVLDAGEHWQELIKCA